MTLLKSTIKPIGLLMAAAILFLAGPAGAETLDLTTCLNIAMENSLDLKKAEQDVKAAQAELKSAWAQFGFNIDTTYSYTRLARKPEATVMGVTTQTAPMDNFSWNVTLTQPLFTGFALVTNKRLKELGLDTAELAVPLARLDLALSVKEAYFGVLLAEKSQLVAEQAVKQLEAQVDVAQNFYDVGMIPKNDLLQVEVELANIKQDLVKAINSVRLAKANLNILLRRDIDTEVELVDVTEYLSAEPDFGASVTQALANRPEMKQAAKAVDIADQGVTLAQADYYPTVALTGKYSRTGDTIAVDGSDYDDGEPWDASLTVGLSWKIFDWGERCYNVSVQKAALIKARHSLTQLKEAITLEVKQALLSLQETGESIEVAEKAIEQAQENFRMSQERYKEQVTTSTEVLDAQTRLSQVQRNYYAALYGYHLAQASLKRAQGEL